MVKHKINTEYGNVFFHKPYEEVTKQEFEWIKSFVQQEANDLNKLCVVYFPSCGCEARMDIVLDRFPMSEKIHMCCPVCLKGILAEISNPIVFYQQITGKEFSLEDLKEISTINVPQKELIEAYIGTSKRVAPKHKDSKRSKLVGALVEKAQKKKGSRKNHQAPVAN